MRARLREVTAPVVRHRHRRDSAAGEDRHRVRQAGRHRPTDSGGVDRDDGCQARVGAVGHRHSHRRAAGRIRHRHRRGPGAGGPEHVWPARSGRRSGPVSRCSGSAATRRRSTATPYVAAVARARRSRSSTTSLPAPRSRQHIVQLATEVTESVVAEGRRVTHVAVKVRTAVVLHPDEDPQASGHRRSTPCVVASTALELFDRFELGPGRPPARRARGPRDAAVSERAVPRTVTQTQSGLRCGGASRSGGPLGRPSSSRPSCRPAGGPAARVPGPTRRRRRPRPRRSPRRESAPMLRRRPTSRRSRSYEVLGDQAAELAAQAEQLTAELDTPAGQGDQIAVDRFMSSGGTAIPLLTSYRTPERPAAGACAGQHRDADVGGRDGRVRSRPNGRWRTTRRRWPRTRRRWPASRRSTRTPGAPPKRRSRTSRRSRPAGSRMNRSRLEVQAVRRAGGAAPVQREAEAGRSCRRGGSRPGGCGRGRASGRGGCPSCGGRRKRQHRQPRSDGRAGRGHAGAAAPLPAAPAPVAAEPAATTTTCPGATGTLHRRRHPSHHHRRRQSPPPAPEPEPEPPPERQRSGASSARSRDRCRTPTPGAHRAQVAGSSRRRPDRPHGHAARRRGLRQCAILPELARRQRRVAHRRRRQQVLLRAPVAL